MESLICRPPRGGEQKQRRRKGRETISPPPLPTKNFHPRVSVNTRPSGIFLTERLLSAYNFPSVFNAPAVHFTHSVHPSPPQADASAAVTCWNEPSGASCKSRTGCVSSIKMSKRVFSLSAETVASSAATCSNTLYCA